MRIRYPFVGALAVLVLLSAYAGLTRVHIAAVNDKALHFVDFFLITVLLYWSVDLPRRLLLKLVLGAMIALAIGSEVLQAALPNDRLFDPIDIAANFLGSALGLGLCNWYHKRMLERKRQQKLQGYGVVNTDDTSDLELGDSSNAGQELGVIPEDDDDGGEPWDEIGGGDVVEDRPGVENDHKTKG